jgi:hypothetical protein
MQKIDLESLWGMLRQMPVMAEIHPLSLAFLPKEVGVFRDTWELIAQLDSPEPQPTRPMLSTQIKTELQHRLPAVYCNHDPLTTELNRVFLKRYKFIQAHMLCQSQIVNEIMKRADGDAVVLLLVDGLSYADIKQYAPQWLKKATPVLVDGISVTDQGMLRIVGHPPLVQRLFDAGFRRTFGFTYWERAKEPLTNRIFKGFGDRMHRVRSFEEVLGILKDLDMHDTFVQIVRTGLDSVAHQQREMPNVEAIVNDILKDFERLAQLFEQKKISATLHLISDHGILWVSEHNLQLYEFSYTEHPRYYEHAKQGEHVLNVQFEGKEFALLAYPFLRREPRANEWGVHGGLSFEESVVPWLVHHVKAVRPI